MVQKILIHRTATPNNPPSGLSQGELSVEMADPLRLWVGVPTSIDPSGKRLLTTPAIVVSDTPPPSPTPNLMWWESDTGILFLWYDDGNSKQWVEISRSSAENPLPPPPDAAEIPFTPGGSLSADDVQEALTELDTEKVAKAGDTMTGALNLPAANPTTATQAAHKGYVDGQISNLTTIVNGKVPEAPNDGQTYGRKNLAWTPIVNINTAANVPFVPAGNVAANNVQTAIQEVDNEKVAKAGDTMTGPLVLSADPSAALGAATKQYVDGKVAGGPFLPLTGGTLSGPLLLAADPAVPLGTATKQYVDSKVAAGTIGEAPQDSFAYGRVNATWVRTVRITGDTMTGDLVIGKATPTLILNRPTGSATAMSLEGRTNNSRRWAVNPGDGSSETGSNVGADFRIQRYDDTGNPIDSPIMIPRNTGLPVVTGNPTAALGIAPKQYVDAGDATLTTSVNGKVARAGDTMTGMLTTAPPTGNIATATAGPTGTIQVISTNPTDPSITFHRQGSFAQHFGMGSDNNMYFGGWSNGAVSYKLWSTKDFAYVPANGANYVAKAGDTMSGSLSAASFTQTGNVFTINGGGLHYNGADYYVNYQSAWQPNWHSGNCPSNVTYNGYVKFANGWILNWGSSSGGGGATQVVVNLAIGFPSVFAGFMVCPRSDPGAAVLAYTAEIPNNGQLVIYPHYIASGGAFGYATQGFIWMAWGW